MARGRGSNSKRHREKSSQSSQEGNHNEDSDDERRNSMRSHKDETETRLAAGAANPNKKVEHEGNEIILVVEGLMEQTTILRQRLISMIQLFQSTVCSCISDLKTTCDCKIKACQRKEAGTNTHKNKWDTDSECSDHCPGAMATPKSKKSFLHPRSTAGMIDETLFEKERPDLEQIKPPVNHDPSDSSSHQSGESDDSSCHCGPSPKAPRTLLTGGNKTTEQPSMTRSSKLQTGASIAPARRDSSKTLRSQMQRCSSTKESHKSFERSKLTNASNLSKAHAQPSPFQKPPSKVPSRQSAGTTTLQTCSNSEPIKSNMLSTQSRKYHSDPKHGSVPQTQPTTPLRSACRYSKISTVHSRDPSRRGTDANETFHDKSVTSSGIKKATSFTNSLCPKCSKRKSECRRLNCKRRSSSVHEEDLPPTESERFIQGPLRESRKSECIPSTIRHSRDQTKSSLATEPSNATSKKSRRSEAGSSQSPSRIDECAERRRRISPSPACSPERSSHEQTASSPISGSRSKYRSSSPKSEELCLSQGNRYEPAQIRVSHLSPDHSPERSHSPIRSRISPSPACSPEPSSRIRTAPSPRTDSRSKYRPSDQYPKSEELCSPQDNRYEPVQRRVSHLSPDHSPERCHSPVRSRISPSPVCSPEPSNREPTSPSPRSGSRSKHRDSSQYPQNDELCSLQDNQFEPIKRSVSLLSPDHSPHRSHSPDAYAKPRRDTPHVRQLSGRDKNSQLPSEASEDLPQKVHKVQEEIEELRRQMARFQENLLPDCKDNKNDQFRETFSTQLLGKADEIRTLLNELKFDCYQQASDNLPDTGQQVVTQRCEKEIKRIQPDFTRTILQKQNIKGDKNRTGKTEIANLSEEMETNVNTQFKDQKKPKNVVIKTKLQAVEHLENLNSQEKRRQTNTKIHKTIKTDERSIYESNKINENDEHLRDKRIVETNKKVCRSEVIEGKEPVTQVLTNIKIRRVFDNKTGKVTETVTDLDDSNDEDLLAIPADSRRAAGEIQLSDLSGSESILIQQQYLNDDYLPDNSKLKRTSAKPASRPCRPSKSVPRDHSKGPPYDRNSTAEQEKDRMITLQPPGHHRSQSASIKVARSNAPEHYIYSKLSLNKGGFKPPLQQSRESGGKELKQTCSKIHYIKRDLRVPGLNYIGCEESDMMKFPSHRSIINAASRLITPEEQRDVASISPPLTIRKSVPLKAGEAKELPVNSTSSKPVEIKVSSEKGTKTEPTLTAQSSRTRPRFGKRSVETGRSKGGSEYNSVPAKNRALPPPEVPDAEPVCHNHKSPRVNMKSLRAPPENITNKIQDLCGNRSTDDFFVSILPERAETKTFRINIIEKSTGDVLGCFFVDEESFLKARDEGVFDNYLSLFVLNSLASYGDFVKLKNDIRASIGNCHICTTDCACKNQGMN